jgi:fumarate reductase subunit C
LLSNNGRKKIQRAFRTVAYTKYNFSSIFGAMTIQNILNLIGLVAGMTGAYLMYHFTPKANSRTIIYTRAEQDIIVKRDAYKNKMVRKGMLLLFIGFLLQVVALLLSK